VNIDFLDPDYKRWKGYAEVISEATGISKNKVQDTAELVGCSTTLYTDIPAILKAVMADVLDPPKRDYRGRHGDPNSRRNEKERVKILRHILRNQGKTISRYMREIGLSRCKIEYASLSEPLIYEDDDGRLYFKQSIHGDGTMLSF